VRLAPIERVPGRAWRIVLLVSPGLWVLGVIVLSFIFGARVQLAPLLAAAPAIACAGTGRRQCVVLGSACALFALVPLPGDPAGLGDRAGTTLAIVIVALASYFVAQRRIRMQRAYDEVRRIADVTQRVLLRPVPERIGPVTAAVEYLSAAGGARIGGDFYEIIETPFGVRAILGDVRGNGLDAVSGAAALLGAFREAGAVEPELESVAARLDAALARHAAVAAVGVGVGVRRSDPDRDRHRGARADAAEAEAEVEAEARSGAWAEDFATAVLVQVPRKRRGRSAGERDAPTGSGDGVSSRGEDAIGGHGGEDSAGGGRGEDAGGDHRPNVAVAVAELGSAQVVICGHPAPYLIRSGRTALALEPESPTLPLGLGSLAAEPYAATSHTVAFEPGDALVLYTDGVSDARSRSGAFFALDEALHGLGELAPDAAAALVRSRLLAHTRGALNDDAALLVLRRVGGDGVNGPVAEVGEGSGISLEDGVGGEYAHPLRASASGRPSGRSDGETPVRVHGAAW
jgi:hypothetical protein